MRPQAARALQAALTAWVAQGRTPGVQFGCLSADGTAWRFSAGVADPHGGSPLTDATAFNGYSIAKTMTALVLVRLHCQRGLDLDGPLAQIGPRFARAGPASLRQTLLHLGGFGNPLPLRWANRVDVEPPFDEAAWRAEVLARHGRPVRAPGRRYAYSNIGYLWLGEVIRAVSGLELAALWHEQVAPTLALEAGEVLALGSESVATGLLARGCFARRSPTGWLLAALLAGSGLIDRRAGHWTTLHPHRLNGTAYGGLVCNAGGLLRYARALLEPGPLVDAAGRTLLLKPVDAPGPPRSLAWTCGRLAGDPWCAHAGGGAGFYAELRLYPGRGAASALLLNRPGFTDARLLDRIDPLWLH